MKCQEVLEKYNRIIPFPITWKKVQEAGYDDPTEYLKQIALEIKGCEDSNLPIAQEFLKLFKDLEKTKG